MNVLFIESQQIGEVNEDGEWTHYLPDGERQVRQTADDKGGLAETWLYDPEGTVLEGPQGPLTHLVCNGTYDWSTGLIHTGGGYFDPRLGIWLMMAPLGVIGLWRRRKRGRFGGFEVLLLFVVAGGLVVGCSGPPPDPPNGCVDKTPGPKPTLSNLSVEFSQLNVYQVETDIWSLDFGDARTQQPGAVVTAILDAPDGAVGQIEWVQDVVTRRVETRRDDKARFAYGDGTTRYLDGSDPFDNRSAENISISSPGQYTARLFDIPRVSLRPEFEEYTVRDEFRTFVMWRPADTCCPREALGMIEWGWSATVNNIGDLDNPNWISALNNPPFSKAPQIPTSEQPATGATRVQDLEYEPIN